MGDGMDRPLLIFSGQSNRPLAQAIAEALGLPLGKSTTLRFANDNLFVRYEESLREGDVFIVQSFVPPVQDHLMELLMMVDAAKGASAARVTAVIPYFSYARSDKKDAPRISITARLIADLLQTAGADRVLTMTLHSPQVHGFFKIPVDHLSAEPVIANYFATRVDLENAVVVAPDAGDLKRASALARRLGLPLAFIDKERVSDTEVRVRMLVGEVEGKTALIVDDEISTAGSLVEAVEALMQAGAKEVYAAATHGVYVGPALDRIAKSPVKEVAATDTCPPRKAPSSGPSPWPPCSPRPSGGSIGGVGVQPLHMRVRTERLTLAGLSVLARIPEAPKALLLALHGLQGSKEHILALLPGYAERGSSSSPLTPPGTGKGRALPLLQEPPVRGGSLPGGPGV